jgi:hypothetical protein
VAVTEDIFNYEFDYNLCLVMGAGPNWGDDGNPAENLKHGEAVSGEMPYGDIDPYSFYAVAGDTISLNVQLPDGVGYKPRLSVVSPDGRVQGPFSSVGSATVRMPCLAQTGNYVALIHHENFDRTFIYSVSLTQSPVFRASSGMTQYLSIYPCESNVFLRWATNAQGFMLEETENLDSPNWSASSRTPTVFFDYYYLAEQAGFITNRSRYYRLRCTNCVGRIR